MMTSESKDVICTYLPILLFCYFTMKDWIVGERTWMTLEHILDSIDTILTGAEKGDEQ